jgi:hypothetical protein
VFNINFPVILTFKLRFMKNDDLTYWIMYFLGFLIAAYITREIFNITRIVKHLRAQTFLLSSIAEKLGVDTNVARKAYFEAEGKGYQPIQTNKPTEVYKAEPEK